MTVEAIVLLSEPERQQLAAREWLVELQEDEWDRQKEKDFSPRGRGAHLVERIDREIDRTIATGKPNLA